MNTFKKFGGEVIPDLGVYVKDYVKKNPGVKLTVGCDSEQYRKHTQYGIVVVMYHEGNGAHYIFTREKVNKIKDLYNRLWGEVERVLLVGEYLEAVLDGTYIRKNPNEKLVDLHLDLNPDAKWKSNMVYTTGVGYLRGFGYRVFTKPYAFASSCAADLICKK